MDEDGHRKELTLTDEQRTQFQETLQNAQAGFQASKRALEQIMRNLNNLGDPQGKDDDGSDLEEPPPSPHSP